MASKFGGSEPFSSECLTEDYELGLRVRLLGSRSTFLRMRGDDGRLVATLACFPHQLGAAIRHKTRWIYGIAFQGWAAGPVRLSPLIGGRDADLGKDKA